MFVVASRPNIKDPLVHFNLCLFPSGNGTKSVWTSSLVFQKPRKETMPSLLLSIDSRKLLNFFQSASLLLPVKDPLVHFNLCLFPSGNGTKSVWTSSLVFQKPKKETMPSLLLSIDSRKLLTFFQSASLLLPVS